jgi:DNA-binding response OmpR family regulator
MADVERSHGTAPRVVLVGIPDDARAGSVARALAAERLMPVTVFTRDALLAFARDGVVSAVVVDLVLGGAEDDGAPLDLTLDHVRSATAAPVVLLGFVPGAGANALGTGAEGLLGVDASAADVVGTVLTALARAGGDVHARARQPDTVTACGDLVVDLRNFEAWQGSQRLALTPTELRILAALVGADGDVVTKHELQLAAWGTAGAHEDNRLQAHMRRLRSKLGEVPGDGACRVRTVRGVGFRLDRPSRVNGTRTTSDLPFAAGAPVHEATGIGAEPSGADR